jgi:hypothetical protein
MNIKQQITESIATSHRTVIIKSRQVGMTSIALDIALAEASTKKNLLPSSLLGQKQRQIYYLIKH